VVGFDSLVLSLNAPALVDRGSKDELAEDMLVERRALWVRISSVAAFRCS
jgi:hypothetical protein